MIKESLYPVLWFYNSRIILKQNLNVILILQFIIIELKNLFATPVCMSRDLTWVRHVH